MAALPPVFVAIPTYNGRRYLPALLDSLRQQVGVDWRAEVHDDASTDGTADLADGYADQDSRITVHRHGTRAGLTGNWNRCLAAADRPLVTLVHQDDLLLPESLARKAQCFADHANVGLVFSAVTAVDAAGRPLPEAVYRRDTLGSESRFYRPAELLPTLVARNVVRASSVMMRATALAAVGRFDPTLRYVVDQEMWQRLAARNAVGWLAQPLVAVRWHAENESHRLRRHDDDLHEMRVLLDLALARYARWLPAPAATARAGRVVLAEGMIQRAYVYLSYPLRIPRARHWLREAWRLDRSTVLRSLRDPRWAALVALAYACPELLHAWRRRTA